MGGYIGSKSSVTVVSPETDSRYVNVAGDTMTGGLTVDGTVEVAGVTSSGKVLINDEATPILSAYATDTYAQAVLIGSETRLQIASSDNGNDGSSLILSTGGHNWVTHATGPNQSNRLRISYLNTTEDGNIGNSLLGTSGLWIDTDGRVFKPAQPRGTLYATTNIGAMPTNAGVIPFDSSYGLAGGMAAATGASARFTVPVAGTYLVMCNMGITATAAGTSIGDGIFLLFRKNGTIYLDRDMYPIFNQGAVNGEENAICLSALVDMSAGDYIDARFEDVSTSYSSINGGSMFIYLLG